MVLIHGDQKNGGRWNVGILMKLSKGRDRILQSVRTECGKAMLETAIQHLYPMSCLLT